MTSVPDDFDRSQLKDRKWKGEGVTMNESIARSPTEKSRRCTDVLCCILFTAMLLGMIASAIYGYVEGSPGRLIAPIDGEGHICGYDPGYEDYPKLYVDDIIEATANPDDVFQYGVCVKSCPENADDAIECMTTDAVPNCTPATGEQYATTDFINYCYPVYDTMPQQAKDNWDGVQDSIHSSTVGGAFQDLLEVRWVLLLAALIAFCLTLIYIKFMDWCAYWLSWISVGLILLGLIATGLYAQLYRKDQIEKDASFADDSQATWLNFYAYMAYIAAGLYLLTICCSFNSLRVAIAVIETAADYFADTKRIIFVPLLYFFIGILFFAAWVAGMLCAASVGEITGVNVDSQSKDIEWDTFTTWCVWLMIFGFLWLVMFLIACNEFVVIVSAITWYYSDKTVPDDDGIPGDSDVRVGFAWTYRYHMGSLAFGSLLVTIVWIIRIIFEYIGEKMHDSVANNGCTKCLFGCIHCCLDCFDRFMRYLTRNAYIYMALSGEGFCSSALNAFILILKNAAKFSFVEGIADMFIFLAKVFIAVCTTLLGWVLMDAMTDVNSPFFPLFVTFLLSYLIASVFMAVFDVSANTILQCYLLDKEIQAQSGLPDPDHIPETMNKFFKHPAVQAKTGDNSSKANGGDEETQNLLK